MGVMLKEDIKGTLPELGLFFTVEVLIVATGDGPVKTEPDFAYESLFAPWLAGVGIGSSPTTTPLVKLEGDSAPHHFANISGHP